MEIMVKLCILHFQPLEYYPPVTNFIDFLNQSNKKFDSIILSTKNPSNRERYDNKKFKIIRYSFPAKTDVFIIKILKHLQFNFLSLINLIVYSPNAILYYESYSAFPVYIYKKYFNSKVRIFIHFHEYFSPNWYKNGMRLVKYYHSKEREFLFKHALWISQTNVNRKKLFLDDNKYISKDIIFTLPNYPPKSWQRTTKEIMRLPIKIIYIGSLSLDSCYLKEFCEYVDKAKGELTFDIFAYNVDETTISYLNNLNSSYISFCQKGVEYKNIPDILLRYDVGVILYKASSFNYIFNAPNKLFEYLSCNLDVWFPTEMKGIKEFERLDFRPRIVEVDFHSLDNFDYRSLVDDKSSPLAPTSYFYEEVFPSLEEQLARTE